MNIPHDSRIGCVECHRRRSHPHDHYHGRRSGMTMADAPEDVTDESPASSLPDCPLCGQSILTATILGPTDAVAAPCGCRTPPEVLLVDPGDGAGDTEDAAADADTGTERDSDR